MTEVTRHFTVGTHSAKSLKPGPVWYSAGDIVAVLAKGMEGEPVTVIADAPSGDVQIQIENSSGNWVTLTGSEYTLTGGLFSVQLRVANSSDYRVIATGAAKFRVIGNDSLST